MIRRKWLSLCIALVLCLLLLPATALAAGEATTVYVGGKTLTGSVDSPAYATTDESGTVTTTGATDDNYNVMWDGATLTLRDATIKEAVEYDGKNDEKIAIYRQSGDLAIALVGENTVDAPGNGTAASCGINLGSGSLTISGEDGASLTVFGGDTTNTTNSNSCGIYARGAITINSGTVNVTGESASAASYGICARGAVTIEDGTVTATGGNAVIDSYGIDASSFTINGGTVVATGGEAADRYSMGVRADGGITINDGVVTATGDTAPEFSYGMSTNGNFTMNGGIVTATSGEARLSYGIRGGTLTITNGTLDATSGKTFGDSVGIFAVNDIKIDGGTVTAKGGETIGNGWYNFGIRSYEGSVIITDGTVTATGGKANGTDRNYSAGIFVRTGSITVSGGTVTATGGESTGSGINYSAGLYARVSVTVSGGTATATGGLASTGSTADAGGSYGIFVESEETSTVTINGNSVVRLNTTGDNAETISSQTTTQENSIVFENGEGTVCGNVTLREDLTVAAGETLTIPEDATLTIPSGVTVNNSGVITNEGTITNNGILTIAQGGTLTGEVTGNPVVYTVTVQTDGKGSASASATTAAAGTTVTLTAKPDSGYRLARWEVVEGDVTITGNRFIMPAENVTVRAVFSPVVNIPDTHEIELIVGEGGEAKLSLTNASAGSTITVTATPDEGFELDYITVDGERIDGTTFTMPEHDVTVRVYFTDGVALPFTDVSTGAWYFDAVSYVYANGLMDGVSDTLFDPDGTMTRAMVWAILARVDGETVTGANWADTAREWAVANGVSDGENASGYVTREQLAAMLWRYAVYKGYDVSIGEDTNILSYADFADLSEYAIPAMQWACGAGVITGVTDSTLVPQGEATRAQVAAMLMRFLEANS